MHRELNSKAEMFRRTMYAVYLVGLFVSLVLGIRAVLSFSTGGMAVATISWGLTLGVRKIGRKFLHFRRLFMSFPFGTRGDLESVRLRHKEVIALCEEFIYSSDWTRRVEIRQRLDALVIEDPDLLNEFPASLHRVHPYPWNEETNKPTSNK